MEVCLLSLAVGDPSLVMRREEEEEGGGGSRCTSLHYSWREHFGPYDQFTNYWPVPTMSHFSRNL